MAAAVNSISKGDRQPSAPKGAIELDVDLDASYPTGGYDISDQLEGQTVAVGWLVPVADGTTKRFARVNTDGTLQVFNDDVNLSEVGNGTDLSGYTGIKVPAIAD